VAFSKDAQEKFRTKSNESEDLQAKTKNVVLEDRLQVPETVIRSSGIKTGDLFYTRGHYDEVLKSNSYILTLNIVSSTLWLPI